MQHCCYGSRDTNVLLVDVQKENIALDPSYDHKYPFGESKESFDENFWQEVRDLKCNEGIDRITALRRVRVNYLKEKCDGDVLVDLITTKHDQYRLWCEQNFAMDTYPTFVFELSQLAEVLLIEDFQSEKPKYLLQKHVLNDGTRRTLLHLTAERNLVDIMKLLLTKHKGVAMVTTYPDVCYALHYALEKKHDAAASLLINNMSNESVRRLFGDHDDQTDELPTFRFCEIIRGGDMKCTVEAILDCLMNPDWPFMPVPDDNDDKDDLTLPNVPFRYHFYYRLLDGDDEGLPGKVEGKVNPEFNMDRTKSCLQLISEWSNSEDAMIRHPVVRMLMRSKWERFGKFWVMINCLVYALFVVAISIAFLCQSSSADRRKYSTHLDYFRLICEIATLFFTFGFMMSEISEAIKCKFSYLLDPFNYFDVSGLVLILLVIPLRFGGYPSAEFGVSAAAYLINVLRISKCATSFKSMSIYIKTFGSIITKDITKFAILWFMFMVSFTGAVYLALKASNSSYLQTIISNYNMTTAYWHVLLQEVRSLAESSGFAETDQYHSMHVLITALLLLNMFFCIVVLNNILIGQIGNSFSTALFDAKVKYDIDRTKLVTRIESQLFCLPWCLRTSHYVDKEFLNNSILEDDLLEDWAMMKQRRGEREQRREDIKSMIMSKMSSVR